MLSFIDDSARRSVRLPAKDGRVACPRLGEVGIEACLECSWLLRYELGESVSVVCSVTDPPSDLRALGPPAWRFPAVPIATAIPPVAPRTGRGNQRVH